MKALVVAQLRYMVAVLATLLIAGTTIVWGNIGIWTSLGLEGRSIRALAIDPKNPNILYAGTGWDGRYNGGVFKSTDGGRSWSALSLEFSPVSVQALMLDSQNPATIYAATWGHGLFKSTDGGANWVNIVLPGGLPAAQVTRGISVPQPNFIGSLAIDPKDASTVYAGSNTYCCPWVSWVYKSTDGGESWMASRLNAAAVTSLAIDPQNPSVLYAGHSDSIDGEGGISKSVDGGVNWTDVGTIVDGNVYGLGIDPLNSGTLYAATMSWHAVGYVGRVFKSSDGGASWLNTALPTMEVDPQHNSSVSAVLIDPRTPTTVYAATNTWRGTAYVGNVVKSTDGGTSWVDSGLMVPRITSLRIDPQDPDRIFAATDSSGVFVLNVHPLLTLDSTQYCIGDVWNLKATGVSPNTSVRLLGTTNGESWEIADWSKTDVNGTVNLTGVFAEGSKGSHTLSVEIGGLQSNTVSFVVSSCRVVAGKA